MPRYLKTVALSILVYLLLVVPAYAQTPSATLLPTREDRQEERALREASQEERTAQREARQEERQARLNENTQIRIRQFMGRINSKMGAALNRLANLTERIATRLVKFKEANPDVDTTQIEANLAEANALLTTTQAQYDELVASLPTLIDDMIASDTPREIFQTLKAEYGAIKANLIEVHRMLVHIIGDIKGLHLGDTESEV